MRFRVASKSTPFLAVLGLTCLAAAPGCMFLRRGSSPTSSVAPAGFESTLAEVDSAVQLASLESCRDLESRKQPIPITVTPQVPSSRKPLLRRIHETGKLAGTLTVQRVSTAGLEYMKRLPKAVFLSLLGIDDRDDNEGLAQAKRLRRQGYGFR